MSHDPDHLSSLSSHTRHPTGLALGSLALNLSLPRNFATDLAARLATVLPALTTVDLSIPILNSPDTRLAPRNRDENLESGRLQLGPGTAVVVDMRAIGEGTLADGGVRNLRALATAVAQQKLEYSFPYSSFELDTDLNFVLLSEGKAIIPVSSTVPWIACGSVSVQNHWLTMGVLICARACFRLTASCASSRWPGSRPLDHPTRPRWISSGPS